MSKPDLWKRIFTMIAALAAALSTATGAAHAGKREKAERLVGAAAETAGYFASDSAFEALWDLSDQAKAMVIIPRSIRAGFIFGGSAGDAVMIARDDEGSWSQPTFMTVGAFSFGFQAGGEASEIILLVMTNRGMEQLLSTSAKLGADLTLAAGPIGAGAKAQTTDILAFSRSRGLYGGVSLEGAVLKVRHGLNEAYYGAEVSPIDVIYRGKVYNPSAAVLQNAVFALANRDQATPVFAPLRPVEEGAPQQLDGAGASEPYQPEAPQFED
ncbi:MAG: lipid-binding SYLF domain-containing protein, partial [Pseudomonadota bacterium]